LRRPNSLRRLIQTNFLLVDYAQFRCQRDQQPGICLSVDVAKALTPALSFTWRKFSLGLGDRSICAVCDAATSDDTIRADVNGMLSQSVTVQTGVKEECFLNPLLFILLLEPLLVAVRTDDAVQGIDLSSHTAKASAFVDDTSLIRDMNTSTSPPLFVWTTRFGMASDLLQNRNK